MLSRTSDFAHDGHRNHGSQCIYRIVAGVMEVAAGNLQLAAHMLEAAAVFSMLFVLEHQLGVHLVYETRTVWHLPDVVSDPAQVSEVHHDVVSDQHYRNPLSSLCIAHDGCYLGGHFTFGDKLTLPGQRLVAFQTQDAYTDPKLKFSGQPLIYSWFTMYEYSSTRR
jgi:hypothetical protein